MDTFYCFFVLKKSGFCPSQNRNNTLESVIKFSLKIGLSGKTIKSNLYFKIRVFILKRFREIIIKESDKVGADVIINTKHLHVMIKDHLNDEAA